MKKDDRATLKIPPALKREIKIEAALTGDEMYTLVEKAFRFYMAQKGQQNVPKINAPQKSPLNSALSALPDIPKDIPSEHSIVLSGVTGSQRQWVVALIQKAVRVLTAGPQGARNALSQNIEYFETTVEPMRRFHGGKSNPIPDAPAESDEGGSQKLLADAKATGRKLEETGTGRTDLARDTKQLTDPGTPAATTKPTKRGGAGSGR